MGNKSSKKKASSTVATMDKSNIKSESVSTRTVTKNGVRTTITERTYVTHDGKTFTEREEKTETVGGGGGGGHSGGGGSPRLITSGGTTPAPSSGRGGGSPSGPVDLNTFREQSLKAHNTRRAKHGVPPLKLSKSLNDYAQKWAEHLIATGSFQHSNCDLNGTRLGENIANKWASNGADYTGEEATEQWYSEISKYTYRGENGSSGTGHFTQVVWKGTTELGMGKAQDGKGKVIVVGSYLPAGNMLGTYSKNVLPPK